MISIALAAVLLLARDEVTALQNVTVVDVDATTHADALHSGMTVLLIGDEIRRVGPTADVVVPEHATVVDGTGKFLIPGLFDMHVHLGGVEDEVMTLLILNGVTSVRDLGGDLGQLDATLSRVASGDLVGPRAARAGYVIEARGWLDRVLSMYESIGADADGLRRTRIGIQTEDDVYEAIGRVVESGADVLKFRNTPSPPVFRFLMEEAKLAGLRVAGHEPNSIDLLEAVSLGIGSLEHTPIEALIRATSDGRWQLIFAAMTEHDVHITPTFVTMKGRRMTADQMGEALSAERQSPHWSSLPDSLVAAWDAGVAERRGENSSIDWDALFARSVEVVRDMHASGVPFLAGTDLGVPFVYPGVSLHLELESLVERAGLSNLDALRAATSTPAAWLGWNKLGAVREGYQADLVLLDANPLTEIANVGRIHTVVSRGVCYGPEARARLFEAVVAATDRSQDQASTLGRASGTKAVIPVGAAAEWDGSTVFGPRVVRYEGLYHMFYVGNLARDPSAPARAMAIGYASSTDGLQWEKHGSGPVLAHPDHGRATAAAMLPGEDGWTAVFSVPSLSYNAQGAVYLATADSPRGPWMVEPDPILRSSPGDWNSRIMPTNLFQLADGTYRLYYWGRNAKLGMTGLGYAVSTDLLNWKFMDDPSTADGPFADSDPFLVPGEEGAWDGVAVTSASVLRTASGWEALYVGYDRPIAARGAELPPLWIGRSLSEDGLAWSKDGANPVLETTQTVWPLTDVLLEGDQYVFYQDSQGGLGAIQRFTATSARAR